MSRPPDWEAFRRSWIAIAPFCAAAVLASAGATLSVLLRVRAPTIGSKELTVAAALYMMSLVPMPALISVLLVGYAWARPMMATLLWFCSGITILNLFMLVESNLRAAIVLCPFVVADAVSLRFVHGRRLRAALDELEEKRRLRWGTGFGWFLLVTASALLVTATAAVLLALKLRTLGGTDWETVPVPLRLIPPAGGLIIAILALGRLSRSGGPMRIVLSCDIIVLVLALITEGVMSIAGAFYLAMVIFAGLGLAGLAHPNLRAFFARQRDRLDAALGWYRGRRGG